MKDKSAFWDTSAVVPLCCGDKHSAEAGRWSVLFPKMIVWWNTRVEIHSALRRLLREKNLSEKGFAQACGLVVQLRDRWSEILPTELVGDLAEECLDRYSLRAADALQLGAALVWCKEKPRTRAFVCFDPELGRAAAKAGFDVCGR
jgi:predicted nucleic acid-binding protein